MAKRKTKKQDKPQTPERLSGDGLLHQLEDQYRSNDVAIDTIRETWDEKERIFFGRTEDTISQNETKSRVYDPRLSSIVMERACRVMAQLPTGKTMALSRQNKGKSQLMNVVLDKYVLPNSTSQFDILTKLRLLDMYSLIYGSFAALVDWVVKDDYIGPDFWLIPIRNFRPQAGVYQIDEMDHVFVDSEVTLDWLLERPTSTWKNIDKIDEQIGKDGSGKPKSQDTSTQSWVEREFSGSASGGKGRYAKILLRTRYERDRWVTYAPEFGQVLRDIDNPHQNGKLPVVVKHAFPLLDRFYGLGEFERGETLQKAINSLINLYLDGIKMSIFPPTIINSNGVVASSLNYQPAAMWLETLPNSIRQHQVSPQGMNTFTNTYQFLNAALLNQAGTTDTSIGSDTDITQGKTPQALKMVASREAARDNWDRFMMERSVEGIFDRMINLICIKQEKPIEVDLFEDDIQQLSQAYPEVMEVYDSGDFGKAVVGKDIFSKVNFHYYIDSGTTMQKDDAMENQALTGILTILLKTPQMLEMMRQQGKDLDMAELIKRWIITSGVQDWDKIITDYQPPLNQQMAGQAPGQAPQFTDPMIAQMAQQLMGTQVGATPPQSMGPTGGLSEGY